MSEDDKRIEIWLSQPYFCLMSNFDSFAKAIRNASIHLTEEPYLYDDLWIISSQNMRQ